MAEQQENTSAIDETPISPVRPDTVRRDSLEKKLQHRPTAEELKQRHVLLDTTAAPYNSQTSFAYYLLTHYLEVSRQHSTTSRRSSLPNTSNTTSRSVLPGRL
jgi:hypothetical protein